MIKKLTAGFLSVFAVFAFVMTVYAADSTVVVTGDTAAGENQPGWLFNRDTNTDTPFEFNNDQASIGNGSLYVLPIGSNPSDKFIGENFVLSPVADVNSISYDFMIGSGGTVADANEFYMNVYMNYGESDPLKYYDCKYDVVPNVGSTAGFTTVTFDPTQSYPVTTRGTSPYTCPSIPADMNLQSADSSIRMVAINVGDTSANDLGLDGYYDNVVVNATSGITTYDFEMPDTDAPDVEITAPSDGDELSGSVDVRGTVEDDNLLRYYTVVRNSANVNVAGPGTVYEDNSFTDESLFIWDTTLVPDGEYTIRLEARDDFNQKDAGSVDVITVTVNNVPDVPTSKDQCKKDGWMSLGDSNGNPFKNQGQCVAFVSSGGKNIK